MIDTLVLTWVEAKLGHNSPEILAKLKDIAEANDIQLKKEVAKLLKSLKSKLNRIISKIKDES